MAGDIISTLNPKDLNEFKRDFTELIRVHSGISDEYSRSGKDTDRYIDEFKKIIILFNKKYNGLVIGLKLTTKELQLRIFIKEKSVKDVFLNAASKLNGLRAVGASAFDQAKIEEADKFSKEIDSVKNKLFISYLEQAESTVFLEHYKEGMVELHHDEDIGRERSSGFKLCSYYAVKGGIEKADVYERLSAIGFVEMPFLEKVRNFFKRFNPRIEE